MTTGRAVLTNHKSLLTPARRACPPWRGEADQTLRRDARIEIHLTPIPSTKLPFLIATICTLLLHALRGHFRGSELQLRHKNGHNGHTFGASRHFGTSAALFARAKKDRVWSSRVTSHQSLVTTNKQRKAKKNLIATTPNSKIGQSHRKRRTSQNLIATKTALPVRLVFAGHPKGGQIRHR